MKKLLLFLLLSFAGNTSFAQDYAPLPTLVSVGISPILPAICGGYAWIV